jgi:uncharacterized protein
MTKKRKPSRSSKNKSQTIRECVRCHALTQRKTKSGRRIRCRLRACTTAKYCWIHGSKIKGLRVKPSQIKQAGLGLYTTRHFKKGQRLDKYKGEVMGSSSFDRRYPKNKLAQYGLTIGKHKFVDGRSTQSSWARYANDARGSRFRNNANLTAGNRKTWGGLVAKNNIPPNREVFTSYGKSYWRAPDSASSCHRTASSSSRRQPCRRSS